MREWLPVIAQLTDGQIEMAVSRWKANDRPSLPFPGKFAMDAIGLPEWAEALSQARSLRPAQLKSVSCGAEIYHAANNAGIYSSGVYGANDTNVKQEQRFKNAYDSICKRRIAGEKFSLPFDECKMLANGISESEKYWRGLLDYHGRERMGRVTLESIKGLSLQETKDLIWDKLGLRVT